MGLERGGTEETFLEDRRRRQEEKTNRREKVQREGE
jgi:hypothetical protein